MWLLWRKANLAHQLPSEIFHEYDPLAAWMLDNCILTFGTLIENALLEEKDEMEVGGRKVKQRRYTITQLLDDNFKISQPDIEGDDDYSDFQGVDGIIYDEVY